MKLNALLAMAGAAALAGCFTVGGGGAKESGTTFAADALAPYVESGELPGAISIFYDNGVQETACVGYSDAAAKRPITLDDHFMQCSQTKGFCGVTIAKLVEEGKMSLDDPVSKYLPEFKNLTVAEKVKGADGKDMTVVRPAKTVLTIRMTQNHTGGFAFEVPNYTSMGGWARRMPLRSAAAVAAGVPLRFDPGTRDSYSNIGIDIGAAVVEAVTGKRWEDFLKERVLDPLGMKDSGFWPTDSQLDGKMELYADDGLDYSGKVYISQSECMEDARAVADLIEARFKKMNGKVEINYVGNLIGSHTGPGTVALFFWGKRREN